MNKRIWATFQVQLQDSEYSYDGTQVSEQLTLPLPSIEFLDVLNTGNLLEALLLNLVESFLVALAEAETKAAEAE